MEDVINHGTAESARAMGFSAPAAGKTGTEHDSWFAGYTSNLLCVVWIGNDDYTDLKLQGAQAALPIWTEFMKEAVKLPQYSDTQIFDPPAGVTEVTLDKATNLIADASCPDDYTAAFLDGTQPTGTCDHPNGDQRNIFQKMFGLGEKGTSSAADLSPACERGTATSSAGKRIQRMRRMGRTRIRLSRRRRKRDSLARYLASSRMTTRAPRISRPNQNQQPQQ